jgi:hypothetical protein
MGPLFRKRSATTKKLFNAKQELRQRGPHIRVRVPSKSRINHRVGRSAVGLIAVKYLLYTLSRIPPKFSRFNLNIETIRSKRCFCTPDVCTYEWEPHRLHVTSFCYVGSNCQAALCTRWWEIDACFVRPKFYFSKLYIFFLLSAIFCVVGMLNCASKFLRQFSTKFFSSSSRDLRQCKCYRLLTLERKKFFNYGKLLKLQRRTFWRIFFSLIFSSLEVIIRK